MLNGVRKANIQTFLCIVVVCSLHINDKNKKKVEKTRRSLLLSQKQELLVIVVAVFH